jgi:TPR repeat protein
LNKFVCPTSYSELIIWFEMILDDQFVHLQTFHEFNGRISQMKVTLEPHGYQSGPVPLNPQELIEDIPNDLHTLFQTLSSFQRERGQSSDEEKLQCLQTRCLGLLTNWKDTNEKIFQFHHQVNGLMANFEPGLRHQHQSVTDIDELRSQITEIRRSFEDLSISTNQIIPQQVLMIDSLNDSLMASMERFNQSFRNILSDELKQLREEMARNQANAQTNKEIFQMIERIHFSNTEKTLQQNRLRENCRFSQKQTNISNVQALGPTPTHDHEDPGQTSYSLYIRSRCGDKSAFDRLVADSDNNEVVCLGYLLLLLYWSDIPDVICVDKDRAILIAKQIIPKLEEKIQMNFMFDHWMSRRSDPLLRYQSLNYHEQFIFGCMWSEGIGVQKNKSNAFQLIKLSADQSHAPAQYQLAIFYKDGAGVEENSTQAVELFTLSANQGYAVAQNYLALYFKHQPERGIKLMTLAANQGYAVAQNNLGLCYENGKGVEKDYSMAFSWYTLATKQGLGAAQNNLAMCWKEGKGVEKNLSKAIRLFTILADQGHAVAQYNLSLCYENGPYQNLERARELRTLAADQGLVAAQENLKYLL